MVEVFDRSFNVVLSQDLARLHESLALEHRRLVAQRERELLQQIDMLQQELKQYRDASGSTTKPMPSVDQNHVVTKPSGTEALSATPRTPRTPRKTATSCAIQDTLSPGRSEAGSGHGMLPKTFPPTLFHQKSVGRKCDQEAFRIIQSAQILVEAHVLEHGITEAPPMELHAEDTGNASKHEFFIGLLDPAVCLATVLHMAKMGISLDASPAWDGWVCLEGIFVAFYGFELVVKLRCLGFRGYVRGTHALWNVLDAMLVGVAVTNLAFQVCGLGSMPPWDMLVALRILRIARWEQSSRFFPGSMFDEMRANLAVFVCGMQKFLWAFLLLNVPVYISALIATSTIGKKDDNPFVNQSLSSLPRSVFSIFRCSIGDCTFSDGTPAITYVVENHGWVYGVVYVLLVMLTTLGIFGLIVGAFVSVTLAAAQKKEATCRRARLSDSTIEARATDLIYKYWQWQRNSLANVGEAFIPRDVSALSVHKEDFEKFLTNADVQTILDDLDISHDDRYRLFDTLDADGGGMLQVDELVSGIMQLRGGMRKSDAIQANLMCRSVRRDLDNFRMDVVKILRFTRSIGEPTEPGTTDVQDGRSSSAWSGSSAHCQWTLPRPPLVAVQKANQTDSTVVQSSDHKLSPSPRFDSDTGPGESWLEVCKDWGVGLDESVAKHQRFASGPRWGSTPRMRQVVDMTGVTDAEIPAPLSFPVQGPSVQIANKNLADQCPRVPCM